RAKHPDGRKLILPMHANGDGFQLGEPAFPDKKPLYALPGIVRALENDVIWVVEGEQKADALNKLGLCATTSGGAMSAPSTDWTPLKGRRVVIWPDHDAPGEGYAGEVAAILLKMECTVSCIDTTPLGLESGGDVIDWLKMHPHATATDVERLPQHHANRDRLKQKAMAQSAPRDKLPNDELLVRRAADICPRPIGWLWPGRIPLGKITLIAGDPALGKSLLTIDLASHVSTGTDWPVDLSRGPHGDVLLLSAEDDATDTIRPRLEAAGARIDRVHIVEGIRCKDRHTAASLYRMVSLKRDLEAVEQYLCRLPQARLLVIDPISAYLDDADSHNNSEVRGLLAPLATLAQQHNVAILCVTHLNKAN